MDDTGTTIPDAAGRRRLLTLADNRQAAVEIAGVARRTLCIWSHDLEPELYDQLAFMDVVRKLILSSKHARVRILLMSTVRSVGEGHRLIEMARRFSTFMEIRLVHPDHRHRPEAFLVADQRAYLHRPIASRQEGVAEHDRASIALGHLQLFHRVWEVSQSASELRRLHL